MRKTLNQSKTKTKRYISVLKGCNVLKLRNNQ